MTPTGIQDSLPTAYCLLLWEWLLMPLRDKPPTIKSQVPTSKPFPSAQRGGSASEIHPLLTFQAVMVHSHINFCSIAHLCTVCLCQGRVKCLFSLPAENMLLSHCLNICIRCAEKEPKWSNTAIIAHNVLREHGFLLCTNGARLDEIEEISAQVFQGL